eukprot:361808-Chlamydomonas_euryale.AAC.9
MLALAEAQREVPTESERSSRDCADQEHGAPRLCREDDVDAQRGQDANADHELVQRPQGAADCRGGNLQCRQKRARVSSRMQVPSMCTALSSHD